MVMLSDAEANIIGGTSEAAATPFLRWNREVAPLSARKLAASLWRFSNTAPGGATVRWQCSDRLGFQFCSSMPIPKSADEGAAKAWDCADYLKSLTLKSGKHVNEGGWSRTNTRKMTQEKASSMKTEWCSVINNLVECVKNERKFCKKMDKKNSNLLRDIAEAKLSARKLIRHLEKEKKAREKLEEVCYGLAREIEGRKAEVGALRNEQRRLEEEMEEERKMQQMGEVWREEQAQMKLADAKFILENKYGEVSEVIANLRAFMRRSIPNVDIPAETDSRCCGNDQADSASAVHYISERNKKMCEDEISCILAKGESERRVNKTKMSYNSKRKANKGLSPKLDNKVSSSSRLRSMSSTPSMASWSRMNPHDVRAMRGHNQWPWRIQRVENLLEAKLES